MAAIWKDYYMEIAGAVADFRICTGGYGTAVIYAGRAVAKPGLTSLRIRINDICADYLRTTVPNWDQRFTAGLLELTFYLQHKDPDAGTWTNYGTVTFTNDWSYDPDYDADRDGYSFPISGEVDPRQQILVTVPAGTPDVSATIRNEDGTTQTVVITVNRTADFNNDYNNDYSHVSGAAQAGVAQLDLSQYPQAVAVTINGILYAVSRGSRCHEFALYYVNAVGGWDALALYGTQEDGYTRHDYAVDYDNNAVSAVGRVDYLNEVAVRWTLHTGMLTELGASRMHHLLGTTCAVIHELATGRILPVTIDTDACKYKTYRSEGRAPIAYEVEAVLAQDRVRR
jgi:hypothetical protein